VTRNVSCGVAFAVSDHVANDGLLGAGKYKAGIRATDLRMKTDRGTSVAVGVTDATFELLRWFYVPFEDGHDAVSPVIARAVAKAGELRRTGPADDQDSDQAAEVDHLADLAEVLGTDPRVRTQVVLARLAERNPREYEDWTFSDLKAALGEHGITVGKSHGHSVVRADDVIRALTYRDHDEGDEEGEEAGN
jgi:S-DNA-T family DNA segregation ATPase FtsK/SpoIIIE